MRTVVIDCPDPAALADLYRQLVGGEVTSVADDWVVLEPQPGRRLAFQKADEYAPPTWPMAEPPQQLHLDVTIDDIDEADPAVLAIGARKHEVQPGVAEADCPPLIEGAAALSETSGEASIQGVNLASGSTTCRSSTASRKALS